MDSIQRYMDRIPTVAAYILKELFLSDRWGILWIGLVSAVVVRPKKLIQREAGVFAGILLACVLVLILAYTLTPHRLLWYLGTSCHRTLSQIAPLAVVSLFTLLGKPESWKRELIPSPE